MEINKEQFRQLIEEGKIGSVINRISDIMHFTGDTSLMDQLEAVSDQYNEYQEAEETGKATDEALAAIKTALLAVIEQLPEKLMPAEAEAGEKTGSGCLGVLVLLLVAGYWLLASSI